MQTEAARRALFDIATPTKSEEWSYECEWRIVTFDRPGEGARCTDYSFHQGEPEADYLGPKISDVDSAAVVSLLTTHWPDTRIVDVRIGFDRKFALEEQGVR